MSDQVTISRTQAYKEIARLVYPDEPVDIVSQRVRQRAYRAQQAGKFTASPLADASFCNWARDTWPCLPRQSWMPLRTFDLTASDVYGIGERPPSATVTPSDPEEVKRRLLEFAEQLEAARLERDEAIKALEAEREAREAAEYRLKHRLKKQSDSGKKGGRGNTL